MKQTTSVRASFSRVVAGALGLAACSQSAPPTSEEATSSPAAKNRVHIQPSRVEAIEVPPNDSTTSVESVAAAFEPIEINGGLRISRMVLTNGVAEREPVALKTPFAPGDRAMIFFEFGNLSPKDRVFTVIWRAPVPHPPHEPIELKVPKAERHRTWSYSLPLQHEGTWTCDLLDERNRRIASLTFPVEPVPNSAG